MDHNPGSKGEALMSEMEYENINEYDLDPKWYQDQHKGITMSWRNDLQTLIAQIELQQDALIPKLKTKQFLALSNLAHEKRSELYDLLGPDAFQTFLTMCQLWRTSHIKNTAMELLEQHGELTSEQLQQLEEITNG